MKRTLTILSILISAFSFAQSGIRITEISYNGPESGSDSTEFVEIYNPTGAAINMNGFTFTSGIVYTFGNVTIPSMGFVVVAVDSVAIQNVFGVTAYQWTSGGLSNGGEPIAIKDASGVLQDSLRYDDVSPWPTSPDGDGTTLVLCDLNANHLLGGSWAASTSSAGVIVNTKAVYGSPGAIDSACSATPPPPVVTPTYPINVVNTTDVDGVADSNGVYCWVEGVVLGVNMSGSGISFTMFDNGGIGVYNGSNLGYTVTEGDSIALRGTVGQYNGLTQMSPDSITLINSGNTIPTPTVVTSLGESTESNLVRFENALVTAVSGSNYTLVSGTDTITMRVDSDTDVLDSLTIAMGDSLCHVIGIGGQFDNSNPYTSGYQLFPRTYMDIDTTCGGTVAPPTIPTYPINVVNTTDVDGVADSNGVYCWVKGVVMGVNMNGNGLSFTMFDNGGIGVYNNNGNLGYTVTEGDSIMLRGTVNQYNGLTQMAPDSITFINAGNTIPSAVVVTTLDETTESNLVTFENAIVTAVSGANYTLVSGTDTITMRIDSDTDVLDSLSILMGDSLCSITGIGGQFDFSSPYTSGYQLFPRTYMDIDTTCGGMVTPPTVPVYPINVVNTTDVDGVADSIGVYCWVKGVVLGVNMNGNGLSFTMYDNGGIGVYNNSGNLGYTVTEGDSIMLRGTVSQFNGLTQLNPDSITYINGGNTIPAPVVVTTLDESTESTLVTFENAMIVDTNGINFTFAAGTDTIMVRFDTDTDVLDTFNLQIGDSICSITGIGGQFDFSSPYTSGYQLFPRTSNDVDTCAITSVNNTVTAQNNLVAFPNPISKENGAIKFNKVVSINVYSISGRLVATRNNVNNFAVSNLENGVYIIKTTEGEVVRMIVK